MPTRARLVPRISERGAVHGRHYDKGDIAEHNNGDSGISSVAVGFLRTREDLEVEAQESEFGEGGRWEVDVAFDDGVFEPPIDLGLCGDHDVAAGEAVFNEDYRSKALVSIGREGETLVE